MKRRHSIRAKDILHVAVVTVSVCIISLLCVPVSIMVFLWWVLLCVGRLLNSYLL